MQKTFCDAKHSPPWLTPQRLCDQRFIAGTSHPNEPWHWLQAFLQTENTGPSNSISTLRLSSSDYKAGCGCCPTGTQLIFHALRYLLQTIWPLRLFLLMWKMWGCFIYQKEWKGPIRQVADAAIKDIWRLWWRFECCMREPRQVQWRCIWTCHSRSWGCCGIALKGYMVLPPRGCISGAAVRSPVSRQKPTAECFSPSLVFYCSMVTFFYVHDCADALQILSEGEKIT